LEGYIDYYRFSDEYEALFVLALTYTLGPEVAIGGLVVVGHCGGRCSCRGWAGALVVVGAVVVGVVVVGAVVVVAGVVIDGVVVGLTGSLEESKIPVSHKRLAMIKTTTTPAAACQIGCWEINLEIQP
jgi:hypothetical protein